MRTFFKYYGFFVESAASLLSTLGFEPHVTVLRVLLPVGISFYTFQTLSYTIDIYRRQLRPTADIVAFFAFVSFFPQLVAGPIERASSLLPQFLTKREFNPEKAADGMRQMLWGFFKKVVIADNVAEHVAFIFRSYEHQDGAILLLGAFFFAIQIYCDFSGYSDIAIGVARLFGFSLMRNFAFPYFSRDIGEFWRRWHISLSSWFRDYVFIPLGGSRVSGARHIFNLILTFTVSGLWHGANWTFVFWGLLNGLYYLPLLLSTKSKKHTACVAEGRVLPSLREFRAMSFTFLATLLAWIFFRAPTIGDAFSYIGRMFSHPYGGLDYSPYVIPLLASLFLLGVEWVQRTKKHALQIDLAPRPARWVIYAAVCVVFLLTGQFGSKEFIYFQF